MPEYYGSSAVKDQFKAGNLPGQYYTLTDTTTGEITVKRKGTVSGNTSGLGASALTETTIGTIDPKTKKFSSTGGSGTVGENTFFNSSEGTTDARQSAQTVTTKAIAEGGDSYRGAVEKTQTLFGTNKSANEEASGDTSTADAEQTADGNNKVNHSSTAKGTRKSFPGANGSAPLTFPEGLGRTDQDVIKFNMLEYVPKGLTTSGGSFGPSDRPKGRKIIGSIVLPIPAGIKDQSNVSWGPNSMNVGQMAAAGIGMELLGDSKEKNAIVTIGVKPTFASTGYGRLDGVAEMVEGNAGVFRSEDGGNSWMYAWKGITPRYSRPMCIDLRPPYWLTVASAPTAFSSYRQESGAQAMLFRSEDGGESWRPLTDESHSPSRANFHGLTVDSEVPGGVLVGTDTGEVWRVTDQAEWQLVAQDMPAVMSISC